MNSEKKMRPMPFHRYQPCQTVPLNNRQWPNQTITSAPVWCSVDLRDGNQALINPMSVEQKLVYFDLLVALGFKEIEVGFPAASSIEYDFMRALIEENKIPDDVSVQILCQCRPELIDRSFEAIRGAKKVIFHLYNSVSTLQRKVVFRSDRQGVKQIATDGTSYVKAALTKLTDCQLTFQYSPESFTGTELDYALEVCHAVLDIWQPSLTHKAIINLPATVEMGTPNIYADQIEWMHKSFQNRSSIILSVHPHNDRGTAVAAAELALMAGAQRVEGTLFGNGERTGNVDIVVLACNLFSQGVDPKLNFTNINQVLKLYSKLTEMPVHPRHPYAGELVYTAFSGSHQDAIKKGIEAVQGSKQQYWQVPYLPIDPGDLGRIYEPIRINSQSGKGGVAFILQHQYGYKLSKKMQFEFSKVIQALSEASGKEIRGDTIYQVFRENYINLSAPLALQDFQFLQVKDGLVVAQFQGVWEGKPFDKQGQGNGPIDAWIGVLKHILPFDFLLKDYYEHTLGEGSNATAASYITLNFQDNNFFGVGEHSDTSRASFFALVSAVNRCWHWLEKSL